LSHVFEKKFALQGYAYFFILDLAQNFLDLVYTSENMSRWTSAMCFSPVIFQCRLTSLPAPSNRRGPRFSFRCIESGFAIAALPFTALTHYISKKQHFKMQTGIACLPA